MHTITKHVTRGVLVTVFTLFGLSAHSQRTLSLDDCIAIALENNIDVKRALNQSLIADLNSKQNKYNFLPSVNGFADLSSTNGLIFDQSVGRLITATTNQSRLQVFADVTLFNGFTNRNNLKIAELDQEAANFDVLDAKDNIKASVISIYLQVVTDLENSKISDERIDLLEKQLIRAEKRVELGVDNSQQMYNLRSQIANENLTKVNLQNQYESDLLLLIQTLLLDPSVKYDIEEVALPDELLTGIEAYQTIKEQAKAYSPSLKSAEIVLLSTRQTMNLAKAAKMPELSIRGTLGSSYSSQNFDELDQRISFFDQIPDNQYRSISFNLRIPIFNKFATNTNIKITAINIANSELANRQAELDLTNNLQRAYLDLVSARSTYKAAEQNLIALEQAFGFMETSYNSGNADLYSYLEALNNKNRAEIDLANSKYSIVLRKKILDIYQGKN